MNEEQLELLKQQIEDEIVSKLSIEIFRDFGEIYVQLSYAGEVISKDWTSLD